MIKIDDFIKQMIMYFPEISVEIDERMNNSFDGLDTIIVEEIIMPKVTKMIENNIEKDKLSELFKYFETVCTNSDEYLLNIFSITTLEILGNEEKVLTIAQKYMGPITKKLQTEADIDLGRIKRHHN